MIERPRPRLLLGWDRTWPWDWDAEHADYAAAADWPSADIPLSCFVRETPLPLACLVVAVVVVVVAAVVVDGGGEAVPPWPCYSGHATRLNENVAVAGVAVLVVAAAAMVEPWHFEWVHHAPMNAAAVTVVVAADAEELRTKHQSVDLDDAVAAVVLDAAADLRGDELPHPHPETCDRVAMAAT